LLLWIFSVNSNQIMIKLTHR